MFGPEGIPEPNEGKITREMSPAQAFEDHFVPAEPNGVKGVEFVYPESIGEKGIKQVAECPDQSDSGKQGMNQGMLFRAGIMVWCLVRQMQNYAPFEIRKGVFLVR